METQIILLMSYVGIAAAIGAVSLGVGELLGIGGGAGGSSRLSLRPGMLEGRTARGSLTPKFDFWFAKVVYQSGLNISVPTTVLAFIFVAFSVSGTVYVLTTDLVSTCLTAPLAIGVCLLLLLLVRKRRLNRFQQEFPSSLDLLARAARAGESLEQSIVLVARASKGPVGYELRQCTKQLEMGLSVAACMKALAKRMDLFDVKIFASTMAIHRQTGGSLAVTLDRLANVIRDRTEYRARLKSVTGAGRFSIGVISVLGPILFAYLFIVQPEYGQNLWVDPLGKWLLIIAVVSQALGLLWVSRVLKADY